MAQFNLYMDDMRPIPVGWLGARTVEEAQAILSREGVTILKMSLDHDMGACVDCQRKQLHIGDMERPETTFYNWCDHALDGTKFVRWLVETGHWSKEKPTVHTANPNGRVRMQELIDKFFGQPALGPMF